MTPEQRAEALRLLGQGVKPAEVARSVGISRNTAAGLKRAADAQPAAQPSATRKAKRADAQPDAQPDGLRVAHRPELAPFPVTLRVRRRDLEEVAFYLQTARLGGALTVDEWLSGRVADLAAFIRHRAPAVVERTELVSRTVPAAPRCPQCKGPALVDQAGRRCVNRGCGWTGKA